MKSSLAEEDEVDFVILSSFKHDLKSPTLKWADGICQHKGTPGDESATSLRSDVNEMWDGGL